MKKMLMIIVPIIVVAIAAGIYLTKKDAPVAEENGKAEKTIESKTDSIVGSLKDAVGLGKKMECIYKDEDGEVRSYIDREKYKSIMATKEGEMISVFDGKDIYSWNAKTKEGYVMKKSCMDEFAEDLPEGDDSFAELGDFETTEEIIEDTSMDNCKETGPIDFSIPKDINFIDQCELMKNLTNSLKDFKMPIAQ